MKYAISVEFYIVAFFLQVLLYLQKCLEYAAGVTEEDRIKNCILPSVAQYVEKLLADVIVEGIHFVLWLVQKTNLNLSTNQMRNEKKNSPHGHSPCSVPQAVLRGVLHNSMCYFCYFYTATVVSLVPISWNSMEMPC